jgi:HAD superfamily phosphatase
MKALLFDMDGVLVDVSRSYREAIKMTVRHYAKSDVSDQEVQSYKERGGLNNDWDLTLAVLKDCGVSISRSEVIDVFQGYYVGNDFDGLIRNENWLLDRPVLEELAARFRIGIVTGRPAAETRHTLRRFDVVSFFTVAVTMDDLPPRRGKPDPLGIRLALSRLGARQGYYAGDSIDDMRAALGAGLVPLGIVPAGGAGSERGAVLQAHGASCVLSDINRIKEVIS